MYREPRVILSVGDEPLGDASPHLGLKPERVIVPFVKLRLRNAGPVSLTKTHDHEEATTDMGEEINRLPQPGFRTTSDRRS